MCLQLSAPGCVHAACCWLALIAGGLRHCYPGKSHSTRPDLLQRLSTRSGDYSYTEHSFKTEVAKGVRMGKEGGGGGGALNVQKHPYWTTTATQNTVLRLRLLRV